MTKFSDKYRTQVGQLRYLSKNFRGKIGQLRYIYYILVCAYSQAGFHRSDQSFEKHASSKKLLVISLSSGSEVQSRILHDVATKLTIIKLFLVTLFELYVGSIVDFYWK